GVFERGDGRAASVVLAGAWLELGDVEQALLVLERAAQLFAGQFSGSIDQRVVDAEWQSFGQQYLQAMNLLEVPSQLSRLRERLHALELVAPSAIVGELRMELERRSEDRRELCSALAAFAFVSTKAPGARAKLLIEAASIAEELGDVEGALVYYRAAVGTQRSSPVARLRLATLMVRMRRHHTEDQAKLLLELTAGLEASVDEEQRELAVFLHAEALTAVGSPAEAVLRLEEAENRIGPRPLIALALAEQAVRQEKAAQALGYFAAALGGDWHGLRRIGDVSLIAARAAATANDIQLALEWLGPALQDPEIRPEALVLREELCGAAEGVELGEQELAVTATGLQQKGPSEQALEAEGTASDASVLPNATVSESASIEPAAVADSAGIGFDLVQAVELTAAAVDVAPPTPLTESGADAPIVSTPPAQPAVASDLVQAVEPDELEMAIAVGNAVRGDPEQLCSWLPDGKRWLKRWTLSVPLAELVLEGVRAESHHAYAAALEQVLAVLRGESITRAPELSETPLVGDALRSLLSRDLVTPELEALELVWDGAEHEFLLEPSDYAITGVLRVSGAASPIARVYSEVVRRFGMQKTPLFYRRSAQRLETHILLFSPAGALLEGEVGTDERWIGYRVGCALWATLPEHSLLFGMTTERVLTVLRALTLAFGATGHPQATTGEEHSLHLAQVLWQTVRSRSQRRLREICSSPLEFERARFAANQALRRAGLYVCGDLELALYAATADIGIDPTLIQQRRWLEVCAAAPDLIDLFQFASSAGYADARWQSGRPIYAGGGARVP
ncbi:MAG TPA: hypothetical protein VKP30_04280, partial [Polyangiaceae bacterium]|nr:hypothetical protein [Polyangiaceae bacterium]